MEVLPVIGNKPLSFGDIGDALHVISLKQLADDADPDQIAKRNSFRSLQQPDISKLDWVSQSDSKEEVCLYHSQMGSRKHLCQQSYVL